MRNGNQVRGFCGARLRRKSILPHLADVLRTGASAPLYFVCTPEPDFIASVLLRNHVCNPGEYVIFVCSTLVRCLNGCLTLGMTLTLVNPTIAGETTTIVTGGQGRSVTSWSNRVRNHHQLHIDRTTESDR